MAKGRRSSGGSLGALASWLAVGPMLLAAASAPPEATAVAPTAEPRVEEPRWFEELPEQLIQLLPGTVLEDAARSFLDRRVELRLDRDKAYLHVRIPLG